jgi:hypothetical protein
MMKRYTIHIRNISLLFYSGLIFLNTTEPLPVNKSKKIHVEKVKAAKSSVKPAPTPFSFFNNVVVPLFPALKI